ncbi:hypothetical protein FGG08_000522 [Glutinoglossum americanum]|uniref:Fucose-specific lectin n=1 Tax=Glutinoglossum americanum TaxID=1670608 RepID=A0A9P8L3P4_9PEZI|nr:hypothetical protein FGG08_000522 [Glutinoglossum americanum]
MAPENGSPYGYLNGSADASGSRANGENAPGLEVARDGNHLPNGQNSMTNQQNPSAAPPTDLEQSHTRHLGRAPNRRRNPLFWSFILTLGILAIALVFIIALSVHHGILWRAWGIGESLPDGTLTVTTRSFADNPPVPNSGLGAAFLELSNYFSPSPFDGIPTEVVYNVGGGTLCIHTISADASQSDVRCIEGTGAKDDTPLTMLDSIGGQSIYFLTNDNLLSGIDYMHDDNDTWRLSPLIKYEVETHPHTQLASLTWLNGTSAWIHYQAPAPSNQIREFGTKDFRSRSWYNGSTGDLGLARPGSGIGVARWIDGGEEKEQLFYQVESGAVYSKTYKNKVWSDNPVAVSGAPDNIPQGANLGVATVGSGSMILLAYVDNGGLLTAQTRPTTNGSDPGAFSTAKHLSQSSKSSRAGLAVVGSPGEARIVMSIDKKIIGLESNNATSSNWTVDAL